MKLTRRATPSSGAPSGGAAPRLLQTAAGILETTEEYFSQDPVANGTIGAPTGYNRGLGPIYDQGNSRIFLSGAQPLPNLWSYANPSLDRDYMDYQADTVKSADEVGLQHYGLWLQCGDQNKGNGIRMAHINTELSMSRYVDGTEVAMTLVSGSRIVGNWSPGYYQLRMVWDFKTKTGQLYVDGVLKSTWSDPGCPFTGGRPGGFTYGCSVSYDNLIITTRPKPVVTGLGSYVVRETSVLGPDGSARTDVIDATGSVQASAWMQSGESWDFQGGPT